MGTVHTINNGVYQCAFCPATYRSILQIALIIVMPQEESLADVLCDSCARKVAAKGLAMLKNNSHTVACDLQIKDEFQWDIIMGLHTIGQI